MTRRLGTALIAALGAAAVLSIAARVHKDCRPRSVPKVPANAEGYVGALACAPCHASQYQAWQSSHHALAMQPAAAQSVLADFNHARFEYAGITSTFFRRGDQFFVNTDGPDGELHDYQIKYTLGVKPLQQYLIELGEGRLQSLTIAWDARTREQGGQRWFHLYPQQAIKAGDPLHWTSLEQNWNHQCAECHSTNLRKNFDAASNRFATTWSALNVACEACHGPGSDHVAWAWLKGAADPARGLAIALDERRGVQWMMEPARGTAHRSAPRTSEREIELCARCHSRRARLTDEYVFGRPLADTHSASWLDEDLYFADGQVRDEVYEYGSFLQSKMWAHGVTCSDCHDPHSQQLRAPGNAVCAQCHLAAMYDGPQHHHHPVGSPGAQCAACHLPGRLYMVIDRRHDHSIRIPRPDRTLTLGTPNACAECHGERGPQWAVDQLRAWYGKLPGGQQRFAEALFAGQRDRADARAQLLAVMEDPSQPPIARASAMSLLARYPSWAAADAMRKGLDDAAPMVRRAAIEALTGASPALRASWLPPLLTDPVRSVRMAAARVLADAAPSPAMEEYLAAQRHNADRPFAHNNLGGLLAERGQREQAATAFKQALTLDPLFVPAAINLADLYRSGGDEPQAEETLRAALHKNAADASLHHALGLALARQQRYGEALAELREATRLAPDCARYAYVYAVALHDTGATR